MNSKPLIFIVISLLLITPSAFALKIYLRPMHQGIINLDVYKLNGITVFPAKADRTFEIRNQNNISMTIEINAMGEIASLVKVEKSFILQPGENKNVTYSISVSEPGLYTGYFFITYIPSNGLQPVSVQSNLVINASKKEIPLLYVSLVLIAVVFVIGFLTYKKAKRKKK